MDQGGRGRGGRALHLQRKLDRHYQTVVGAGGGAGGGQGGQGGGEGQATGAQGEGVQLKVLGRGRFTRPFHSP